MIWNNGELIFALKQSTHGTCGIEMVASYGMPVGKDIFDTCVWIGRFQQELYNKGWQVHLIYRRDVKLHHCGQARAKDNNIRQVLIDKYGEKGTKDNPGITYGLKADLWQAFALATYMTETEIKHA